jgi:hypothetical protein
MIVEDYVVKALVELSNTEKEADRVIEQFASRKSSQEKYEFLTEQFPDISIVAGCAGPDRNPIHTDYQALLCAVVNSKWR